MRLLVCGDRNWADRAAVARFIAEADPEVVIHGAARGADSLAGEEATRLGISVEAYPADWTRYGRAAGPVRNQQMLTEGRPDAVLAFHEDITNSKGTADMVRRARKAGLPVTVVDHGG